MAGQDWESARVIGRFLEGRLQERETLEWALKTTARDVATRAAVVELLSSMDGRELSEPWLTAWRLVEELWSQQWREEDSNSVYRIGSRISGGERTGSLIQFVVNHVEPRIDVSIREPMGRARKARTAADLVRARVTSATLHAEDRFALDRINEAEFLLALTRALEGAVEKGLELARRLGWEENGRFWQLGDLRGVAYRRDEHGIRDWDVDEFHRGIAPSVKLLHAVVRRLSALSASEARRVVRGWSERGGPIHLRLWAAMALDVSLVAGGEVAEKLDSLGEEEFWDVYAYPEVAELRAVRFADLPKVMRERLENRVARGAQLRFLSRRVGRSVVADARQLWSLRELRRIEVAGGELSPRIAAWLRAALHRDPGLADMTSARDGLWGGARVQSVSPAVVGRFDALVGDDLLRALESALGTMERSWDNDPLDEATAWIAGESNSFSVLSALEAASEPAAYPRVLGRLGWSLDRPSGETADWLKVAAQRMLALVLDAPVDLLAKAIEGVSYWMSAWAHTLEARASVAEAWHKLWPLAVAATNARAEDPRDEEIDSGAFEISEDEEPREIDTLNDPAGRLVGVFLSLCPKHPGSIFDPSTDLARMRGAIASEPGRAGLIGLHRMVEKLPFFLASDPDWAQEHLILPLRGDDARALILWRAFSRRIHRRHVLEILGGDVLDRIQDRRLGRERRETLLSSIVIDVLYALLDNRPPAVEIERLQQAIRVVDGEIRARSAQRLQEFLSAFAGKEHRGERLTAEVLFDRVIGPFLSRVWPPERSLASPGVSRALADLPVSAGDRMPAAVATIEPFLIPFECWSMHDFGLRAAAVDGGLQLREIDSSAKASALLKLLDATIGIEPDAIVPIELGDVLEHIAQLAPSLGASPSFRRLSVLVRRRSQ